MKTHIRILYFLAILALGLGWIALRRGNVALAAQISATAATGAETGR